VIAHPDIATRAALNAHQERLDQARTARMIERADRALNGNFTTRRTTTFTRTIKRILIAVGAAAVRVGRTSNTAIAQRTDHPLTRTCRTNTQTSV
jgi:hypothetical protein